MAKGFTQVGIDFDQCRLDLVEFKSLLDQFRHGTLKEREHVVKFFRDHQNLAALIGYVDRKVGRVDRIAYEFDFFGDYTADLAVGDSKRGEYCFVEFEEAGPNSIFKKAGKKATLEWSDRFDHGYSQIIDWFWKLHDLARTNAGQARFGHPESFDYYGLLVIGRSDGFADFEKDRFEWRRKRVVVDSRTVHCMTFDELYDDLEFQLERYAPAALVDSGRARLTGPGRGRSLPKKKFGWKPGSRPIQRKVAAGDRRNVHPAEDTRGEQIDEGDTNPPSKDIRP